MPKALFRAAISYAHGRFEREALALADRLNREGVDCEIDFYDEAPPQGWPQWMLDTMEDRVILAVCTEEYAARLKGEAPEGVGRGVVFEGRLIRQQVYEAQGRNEGVVPIVFDDADVDHIPVFLRDVTHYNLSTESGYEALYRRLTKRPRHVKPPLGQVRELPDDEPAPPVSEGHARLVTLNIPRLGYGRSANALTFSNIGANARPLYDSQTVEYFDSSDDAKIGHFVRQLPGWQKLKEREISEGVMLSDLPDFTGRDFGLSKNGMYVCVDGSIAIRSSIVGAHFLYDVQRILASLFATCLYLHREYRTYPVYNAAFGYSLLEEPYPKSIGQDPYDGPFRLDVRRPFEESVTSAVLMWSRSSWPIALTKEEVSSDLARFWEEGYSQFFRDPKQ